MKKKILILITKGEIGGAQQSVFNLATQFKELGHDVVVGFDGGSFLDTKLKSAGIEAHYFANLHRSLNPFKNWSFATELQRYLQTESKHGREFDIVYCNSSNTLFGAEGIRRSRLQKQPKIVFTHRGLSVLDRGYRSSIKRLIYRIIFKKLLKHIDAGVYVSQANFKDAKLMGLTKEKDVVIYNGILPCKENFTRAESRLRLTEIIGEDIGRAFVVGSIGRLAYQKNFGFLIRSVLELSKKIPDLKVVIIGEGPEKTQLQASIKNFELEKIVFLAGGISDAARFLAAFDVFVLPSRFEGMSITLIEALQAHSAIVTTNIEANAETVGEAGALFSPNDSNAFQRLVEDLYNNPNEIARLKAQTNEQAKKFNIACTANKYDELFEKLCAE